MSPTLNNIVSSLQRSGTFINSLIAASTIGGQQLFSSFTFKCPCQVGKNFYYGSAFLLIPALLLLVAGYALRSQMWTMSREYCCSCAPPRRRISLLERKLACLRFFSITGRALVAPLTWLAATLLTGTYYECAASEFASVDRYAVFDNVSASRREQILAGFPCCKSTPSDMIQVRDEVALLHRYQSQVLASTERSYPAVLTLVIPGLLVNHKLWERPSSPRLWLGSCLLLASLHMLGWILITLATVAILVSRCLATYCSPLPSRQHWYWTNHLRNERELFEQAAEQHSRLLITKRIQKLFGFIPGKEDVKRIRIPSCQDWKEISAPGLLCMGDDLQGHYSFLRDRLDEESEESKSEGIELRP